MKYNPVTEEILTELREIVGGKNVMTDQEKIEAYSHDETPAEQYAHMPEVVLTPNTAEEIAAVMKLANRELIPVTPYLTALPPPAFSAILPPRKQVSTLIG